MDSLTFGLFVHSVSAKEEKAIVSRLYKDQQGKKTKNQLRKMVKDEREMEFRKTCTFTPKLNKGTFENHLGKREKSKR